MKKILIITEYGYDEDCAEAWEIRLRNLGHTISKVIMHEEDPISSFSGYDLLIYYGTARPPYEGKLNELALNTALFCAYTRYEYIPRISGKRVKILPIVVEFDVLRSYVKSILG